MNTKIKWVDNAMFVAKSGSGHSVVMDGPEDFGGQNLGVRPMEMVLMGLGGCTAFDVLLILKKGRHNVTDCEVEIENLRVTYNLMTSGQSEVLGALEPSLQSINPADDPSPTIDSHPLPLTLEQLKGAQTNDKF